jgi:hypothetical protein
MPTFPMRLRQQDLDFQKASLVFEREDLEKKADTRLEEMLFATGGVLLLECLECLVGSLISFSVSK